jgi:hypothetical protein
LSWQKVAEGWALNCYGRSGAVLHVVPDTVYPGMWRVRFLDGGVSDMANITWARDGAVSIALAMLNREMGAAA